MPPHPSLTCYLACQGRVRRHLWDLGPLGELRPAFHGLCRPAAATRRSRRWRRCPAHRRGAGSGSTSAVNPGSECPAGAPRGLPIRPVLPVRPRRRSGARTACRCTPICSQQRSDHADSPGIRHLPLPCTGHDRDQAVSLVQPAQIPPSHSPTQPLPTTDGRTPPGPSGCTSSRPGPGCWRSQHPHRAHTFLHEHAPGRCRRDMTQGDDTSEKEAPPRAHAASRRPATLTKCCKSARC